MKFIVTQELGRLAKWLRILGYDAAYFSQRNPSSLLIQALRDDRVIVTRNHRLPKTGGIRIVLLESDHLKEQMQEALKQLKTPVNCAMMFTRCTVCNLALHAVEKEKIKDSVPEYVFQAQQEFSICPACKRVYWPGSHWGNVRQTLAEIGL